MTSRAVPRSRAGVIRLSDQPIRDLRRGIEAASELAANIGRAFSLAADAFLGARADRWEP